MSNVNKSADPSCNCVYKGNMGSHHPGCALMQPEARASEQHPDCPQTHLPGVTDCQYCKALYAQSSKEVSMSHHSGGPHNYVHKQFHAQIVEQKDAEIARVRGQLEAAEQHVKILQEQRASPEMAERKPGHVQIRARDAAFAAQVLAGARIVRSGDECEEVGRRIAAAIKAAASSSVKAVETIPAPANQMELKS